MGPPTILTEMSNSTYWALKRALGCRVLAYDYVSALLVQSDPGRKGRFRLNAEFSIFSDSSSGGTGTGSASGSATADGTCRRALPVLIGASCILAIRCRNLLVQTFCVLPY